MQGGPKLQAVAMMYIFTNEDSWEYTLLVVIFNEIVCISLERYYYDPVPRMLFSL